MIKDTKTEGWREALKDKVCSRTDFVSNVQYVHTPWTLGSEMLDKVTESVELAGKRILTINLEFVELLMYDYSVKGGNIVFITDCQKKADICKLPRYAGVKTLVIDFETLFNCPIGDNMKFDVIVGNPPYQAPQEIKNEKGISGGGATLWDKFIVKSTQLLKEGGYLCYVHPAAWRGLGKNAKEAREALHRGQIQYLEVHNAEDGLKTFGATTRYDWYVWQNVPPSKPTTIQGEDGKRHEINLKDMPFIPNGMYEEIQSLVAKDGEERVEVLHSYSAYETRKEWLSKEQKGKYQYPCVYYVDKQGKPTLWYSSTKDNGHFKVPKVIFASGVIKSVGYMIDAKGEYGLTQFAKGIVDSPKTLPLIAKALDSQQFRTLMEMCVVAQTELNKDILSTFRKDFWKAFV